MEEGVIAHLAQSGSVAAQQKSSAGEPSKQSVEIIMDGMS